MTQPALNDQPVICPYCQQPAVWVDNIEIYGKRYGKSHMVWLCRPCDAYVGCHNNTRRPLGPLADSATRWARTQAHGAFDPIWRSKSLTRTEAYAWLSQQLGRSVHIGEATAEQCREIMQVCRNFNSWKSAELQ